MTGKSGGSLNTIADNATILLSSSSRYKTIQNDDIKIKYLGLFLEIASPSFPFVKLRQGSGKERQVWRKVKGLKA